MTLKGLLYRKLKEKEQKDVKSEFKEEKELEKPIRGRARYCGGHFLHPIGKSADYGNFILDNEKFTFEKIALLFSKYNWTINIPLNKIIWNEVSQDTGEDFEYKQEMSASAYFATGLPVSSISRNITYLTIPYKDEKGVIQRPRFTFRDEKILKKVSEFFFEKIAKIPNMNEKKVEKIEDPLKILKLRYAKGEITKKEYEEMKEDLAE